MTTEGDGEGDADLDYSPPPAPSLSLDYDKIPDTGSLAITYDPQKAGQDRDVVLRYDTPGRTRAGTARFVVALEYAYGALGLVLGLACVLGGCVLGLNGVAGSTSWTASFLGAESQLNDAAPGVVLFIVGVFLVWITKPKVKAKNLP